MLLWLHSQQSRVNVYACVDLSEDLCQLIICIIFTSMSAFYRYNYNKLRDFTSYLPLVVVIVPVLVMLLVMNAEIMPQVA